MDLRTREWTAWPEMTRLWRPFFKATEHGDTSAGCSDSFQPGRSPMRTRTIPMVSAMTPTIGLNTIVWGLETSILKKPTSATRSVVKYVILGIAKATMPRTTKSRPTTANGRISNLPQRKAFVSDQAIQPNGYLVFPKYTNKYERKTTRKAPAISNHLLAFGVSGTSHSCHSN